MYALVYLASNQYESEQNQKLRPVLSCNLSPISCIRLITLEEYAPFPRGSLSALSSFSLLSFPGIKNQGFVMASGDKFLKSLSEYWALGCRF